MSLPFNLNSVLASASLIEGYDIINQDDIKNSNKFYIKVIASIEFLKGRGLC
jgi:hypothetical protein